MKHLITAAFCLCAAPAVAQPFETLLNLPEGRAGVLCLSGPEDSRCASAGQLHPGGRTVRTQDRFVIASLAKTVMAVAMLQLVEAGKLGLDDPAADWLPGSVTFSYGGLQGVTLRHLLAMRSGLGDYYTETYLDEVLSNRDEQRWETALIHGSDAPRLFDPGTRFAYSNTNYVLLQIVIKRASGLLWEEYFQRHIFAPAGMANTFVFGTRDLPDDLVAGFEDYRGQGPEDMRFYYRGQGFGDGGLISSAGDLIGFYRALFEGEALLSPVARADLLADPENDGYGLGISVDQIDGIGPVYGHSGGDLGYVADIRYAPDSGRIAVALIASSDGDASVTLDLLAD